MLELRIGKNDSGQRLDKFLSKALSGMPFPMIYRLIRQKKIKLNRKRAEPSTLLSEGDTVLVFAPPRFTERSAGIAPVFPQSDPDVVYEDENVLILFKPEGMLVHEGDGEKPEGVTLIALVSGYLYRKGEYRPEEENSFAPALANRIDRNTSGLVLAAKNAAALRALDEAIRERRVTKKYLCVVHGRPTPSSGSYRGYLLKNEKTKTVAVFDSDPPGRAKEARTDYRVLSSGKRFSLVEAELFTGRTHQIRAQFSHAGHPLLGDGKYGETREDRKLGYRSQALCSFYLRFGNMPEPLAALSGREVSLPDEKIPFLADYRDRLQKM